MFSGHKIEKFTRDGLTLNGISDAGSNSGFLVFPVGIKWEHWAGNEFKQEFERAQQNFIELYEIPN